MSIFTGVTTPHKLGGIFGLSCYLVMGDKIKDLAKEASEANKDTPFFMGHGDSDPLVKLSWGQQTAEVLRKDLGHKVEFKSYRYADNVTRVLGFIGKANTNNLGASLIPLILRRSMTWRNLSRIAYQAVRRCNLSSLKDRLLCSCPHTHLLAFLSFGTALQGLDCGVSLELRESDRRHLQMLKWETG